MKADFTAFLGVLPPVYTPVSERAIEKMDTKEPFIPLGDPELFVQIFPSDWVVVPTEEAPEYANFLHVVKETVH